MPTIYGFPDTNDRVYQIRDACLRRWHQPLHKAEVRVGIIWATSTKEGEPAIKKGGDPVLACIQVMNLKMRLLTNFDALVMIDKERYDALDDASQVALLDHELSHVELKKFRVKEEEDEIWCEKDDLGRPKMKSKPGDILSSDGFLDVVKRHGPDAVEAMSINRAATLISAAVQEALADEEAEAEMTEWSDAAS